MLVQAHSIPSVLGGNTVENMLHLGGYSDTVIKTLKRPFNSAIYLSDGMLIRQKFRLNEWADGYLYILVKHGEELFDLKQLKLVFKLMMLFDTACMVVPKEAKNAK